MNLHYHELLVVGAGPAGLAAAAAAYDAGVRDTLLLEKEALPGGRLRLKKEPSAGSGVFRKELGGELYLQHFLELLRIYELPQEYDCIVQSILPMESAASEAGSKADAARFLLRCKRTTTQEELLFSCRSFILASGADSFSFGGAAPFSPDVPELSAALSLPGGFLCGDLRALQALPDSASIEGARAGREAADFLRSLRRQ